MLRNTRGGTPPLAGESRGCHAYKTWNLNVFLKIGSSISESAKCLQILRKLAIGQLFGPKVSKKWSFMASKKNRVQIEVYSGRYGSGRAGPGRVGPARLIMLVSSTSQELFLRAKKEPF